MALSPLHPPCFQRVDEQAECPEIHERRSEGGLLLMMCGALKRSLEARSERAEVEAEVHDRQWYVACRMPGVASARYAPQEARSRAEIWQANGYQKLADALRAAAEKAERRQPSRARAAIGVGLGALAIAAAAGWFLMVREPRVAPARPPDFREVVDASRTSVL